MSQEAPGHAHLSFGQPFVLISQIQRSGGTLMSQLLDGHPQILAHPHELHIGRPRKWDWPDLDLEAGPAAWFENLYEQRLEDIGLVRTGRYVKPGSNPHAQQESHPFNFDPGRQREVFVDCVTRRPPTHQRDILDCFFASFFAAWNDYQATGAERIITAFCPRVLMAQGSFARLRTDYPDGKVISIVRDPKTWYVSSSRHARQAYPDVTRALALWRQSTQTIMAAARALPDHVVVLTYEALTGETETTMRRLAGVLGVDFDPVLLMPTYLGRPKLPNSSFAMADHGVADTRADRLAALSDQERAMIAAEGDPLYAEAASLALV